ncbi:MAG: CIA30 family protein, partial [Waterburya sp.]
MGKWEVVRLWQTLNYFEVIPLINCWQSLFKSRQKQISNHQQTNMVILVAGATGGVGKRVVKKL